MLVQTISQYLGSHKRLVVPQLGTFIVKEPGVSIVFSELLKRDDGVLRGLLPICSSCKKIRDDQGYWKQVEHFVTEHTGARFSHGICPSCMGKLYGSIMEDKAAEG